VAAESSAQQATPLSAVQKNMALSSCSADNILGAALHIRQQA
jgi:hypothetical protein